MSGLHIDVSKARAAADARVARAKVLFQKLERERLLTQQAKALRAVHRERAAELRQSRLQARELAAELRDKRRQAKELAAELRHARLLAKELAAELPAKRKCAAAVRGELAAVRDELKELRQVIGAEGLTRLRR